MSAAKVRIGAVGYLNSRPLVRGLDAGAAAERIDLSYDVPSRLAERMRAGELDVALLPVIELAALPELEIVPGLGITTRGPARSVLLVSKMPVESVRRVALDPESRTSNVLVRVLFERVWRAAPEFAIGPGGLEAALETADAAVRIGDKALFEPAPEGALVLDLGAAWTAATRLPFVFAVWAARPGVVDRGLYRLLHEARRRGSREIEAIAREYVFRGRRDPDLARRYLEEHILHRLGAAEVAAIERFLAAAAELGLVPALSGRPRFALERTTACHEAAATEVRP